MTFDKAFKALLNGDGIARKSFSNHYCYQQTSVDTIHFVDKEGHRFGAIHLSSADLLADDWIIIKIKRKQDDRIC